MASASRLDGHGIGIQTCDHPYSATSPTVPISTPAAAPNATGAAARSRSATTSTHERLDEVEREVRHRLAEDVADDQRDRAADDDEEDAAPSAPPRPIQIRAATSATPAAKASMIGSRTSWNCGTPKSNSAWKVERPIRSAAHRKGAPVARDAATTRSAAARGPRTARARRRPSTIRIALPTRVSAGAADQHQVRRPPEGDVLAEDPVPDVVERETDQRERRGGEHRDAAERRVPVAGDADRPRGWACPSGRTIARKPAVKMPKSPTRIR